MPVFRIDNREHKLKDHLQELIKADEKLSIEVVLQNLECGDFILEYEGTPVIVIERKTLADLVASIKDGRYRSQKARLVEAFGREKVLYVVEGDYDYCQTKPCYVEGMDKYSVLSSIINTLLRDGIRLVSTKNMTDTMDFLMCLLVRFTKDPNKYVACGTGGASSSAVGGAEMPITKGKVFTKQDLFFHQLCQVPGISSKTANAFVKRFDSMCNFYQVISEKSEEEKLKILKSVTTEENNKVRRISSKVAEAIIKYMF